jgi:2-dehydro-3-deoxyphosphogluconate aldolase/(4S)-4-hydroxy-2-oxoglutarate aldolase
MSTDLTAVERTRLIAIVRLPEYSRAIEVARALVAGGITVLEFTLTGQGAAEAIARTRAALGADVLVGAGTVLQAGEVAQVAASGAQFVVTPVLKQSVIEACHAQDLPIICGAFTPTEIQSAYEAGAAMVKVFPARQLGPHYIRDILAPLPHARLVPTGGIHSGNLRDYLAAGAVAVGLGGNLISEAAVAAEDWEQITRQARACVEAAHGVSSTH